eukprot:4822686-Lingulodinium_polyedra.AAC.1
MEKPRLRLVWRACRTRPCKFTATAQMLRWVRKQCDLEGSPDRAVMRSTLLLAWFFLMRLTEYAYVWSRLWDLEKVLTGADAAARKEGKAARSFRDAG